MLTKTAAAFGALLGEMRPKCSARTTAQRISVCLQISILALACVAVAAPAFARSEFDGDWSVVIMSRGGACEPSFRYSVEISNGKVINTGGAGVTVQGRVTPRGNVRVVVQSGNEWADGSGRLGRNGGGGIWRGQGSSGACEGTWMAERRPNSAEAAAAGTPIYNYVPEMAGQGRSVISPHTAFCEARFRSYDPATGTYLGYDGLRHPCR